MLTLNYSLHHRGEKKLKHGRPCTGCWVVELLLFCFCPDPQESLYQGRPSVLSLHEDAISRGCWICILKSSQTRAAQISPVYTTNSSLDQHPHVIYQVDTCSDWQLLGFHTTRTGGIQEWKQWNNMLLLCPSAEILQSSKAAWFQC